MGRITRFTAAGAHMCLHNLNLHATNRWYRLCQPALFDSGGGGQARLTDAVDTEEGRRRSATNLRRSIKYSKAAHAAKDWAPNAELGKLHIGIMNSSDAATNARCVQPCVQLCVQLCTCLSSCGVHELAYVLPSPDDPPGSEC